jgi:hypothetical protein
MKRYQKIITDNENGPFCSGVKLVTIFLAESVCGFDIKNGFDFGVLVGKPTMVR